MLEDAYCAHSQIPGYSNPHPNAIHEWGTRRIYIYCVKHDLREVWAYLWENWLSWVLGAITSPIPESTYWFGFSLKSLLHSTIRGLITFFILSLDIVNRLLGERHSRKNRNAPSKHPLEVTLMININLTLTVGYVLVGILSGVVFSFVNISLKLFTLFHWCSFGRLSTGEVNHSGAILPLYLWVHLPNHYI